MAAKRPAKKRSGDRARSRARPKAAAAAEPADPLAPGGSIEEVASGIPAGDGLPTLSQLIVRAGVASWSLVGAFLILAAVFLVLREVRVVFPPMILAFVVVLLLEPLVARLVARGVRRGLAVAVTYIAVIGVLVGAGFVVIPAMVDQGQEFAEDLPRLIDEGGSLAARTLRRLNQDELGRRIRDSITDFLNENAGSVRENVTRFARFGLRLANFLVTLVVGLILAIYVLLELPRMGAAFTRVVPAERRAQLAPVSSRVREVFIGYMRARLIVSTAVGALAIIGLWLAGMPFWLILGVIVGVTNIVPLIGAFLGAVPVLLVAILTKPPAFLLVALIVLIVAHAVDGYLLSPRLLGTTTQLHPVAVLLAVLVGGALLGVWGIIIGVPIAGAIQVVVLELLRRRRMEAETEAVEESPA